MLRDIEDVDEFVIEGLCVALSAIGDRVTDADKVRVTDGSSVGVPVGDLLTEAVNVWVGVGDCLLMVNSSVIVVEDVLDKLLEVDTDSDGLVVRDSLKDRSIVSLGPLRVTLEVALSVVLRVVELEGDAVMETDRECI